MKRHDLSTAQIAFIAATRALLGGGIGLLASQKIVKSARKTVGWSLVALGALTTIPAARAIAGKSRSILG
jgi:hypothetical protein